MKRTFVSWLVVAGALLIGGIVVMRLGYPHRVDAQKGCTVNDFRGTYGIHGQGWEPSGTGGLEPVAQIGRITTDGFGNMSVALVASLGGELRNFTITGTYQVNSDCTGSFSPNPGPGAGPANFVIVDGGKQFMLIGTTPGTVISGIGVRQ